MGYVKEVTEKKKQYKGKANNLKEIYFLLQFE